MDASLETSSRLIHTITYLSKLASEARAIDKELDILRVITAQAKGAPLNADQEAALRQVEHNLRDYLINRDPLRKFTPETLEQRLQEEALQAEQARPAGL